jgi:gamma-glutamylcyclotransferase (GGCT)/AIG2-like uncharacterized protein YtfP
MRFECRWRRGHRRIRIRFGCLREGAVMKRGAGILLCKLTDDELRGAGLGSISKAEAAKHLPENSPRHLFVYGTLTRGSRSPFAALLAARARFIGDAWIAGRFYRLSHYPGAVPDPASKSRIWGNVFLIRHPALLAALDQYEGCGAAGCAVPLFQRDAVRVTLANGKELDAWIYRFTGGTEGRPAVHKSAKLRWGR